jgi:hypothetical protein
VCMSSRNVNGEAGWAHVGPLRHGESTASNHTLRFPLRVRPLVDVRRVSLSREHCEDTEAFIIEASVSTVGQFMFVGAY